MIFSKYEVAVAEFRRFVESTAYVTDAERNAGGKESYWALDQDADWNNPRWASWRKPNQYHGNEDRDAVSCAVVGAWPPSWRTAAAAALLAWDCTHTVSNILV